jgi:long-subunit acyl-CoA synthetase (AMP-forming)
MSSEILRALAARARDRGDAIALIGENTVIDYAAVDRLVAALADQLHAERARMLGMLLDNSPAWAVIDLAALKAGVPSVPLPGFFSDTQIAHALRDAGVDTVLTDQPERLLALAHRQGLSTGAPVPQDIAAHIVWRIRLTPERTVAPPERTAKITYTSGTTGAPKGVCLELAAIERVTTSLLSRLGASPLAHHLSLLPLATLLENIGGVYLPLLAGGTCHLLSARTVGVQGAAGLDTEAMLAALRAARATSAIMIPQMLNALVLARETGAAPVPALRFVAVGGAPVSPTLLARAKALDLPVFEGYGLSECASVVALNTPGNERTGSVGVPLPHVRLRVDDSGEIHVAGALFRGYLGGARNEGEFLPTGDIGHVDADGFVFLTGRKKNMFITAFGRNVAPEWVERELALEPTIAQASVFGEARTWNTAVIVPRGPLAGGDVERAIVRANRRLPDYARVRAWVRADVPFTVENGQWTGTGRPRRERIWAVYGERIARLYAYEPLLQEISL